MAENERGKSIITATHDMHIVEEIADTVHVFSEERKIIRSGTPVEVLSDQPFLQAHNLVHIHRHRHKDKVHAHPHQHIDNHH
jgi:cobalt/nickel transport system ATP-binding protein